ncbi:MAG: HAMP domain-containing protein, partial [Ktedonobacteraceae bacterium]|nr:HAMP domain-containing protein [Ktedonobacteraceae bacterium]
TNINSLKAASTAEEYLITISNRLESAYSSRYGPANLSAPVQTTEVIKEVRLNSTLFENAVKNYQQNYQLLEAPQMQSTLDLLRSNDPQTSFPTKQQNAISDILVTLLPQFKSAQAKITQSIENSAPESQAAPQMLDALTKLSQLHSGWDTVIEVQQDISGQVSLVGPAQTMPIIFMAIAAFILTLLATFGIGSVTFSTIIKPLQELSSLTERISNGETNARVNLSGRDEINRIADSMNTMLDNIVRLIQETQSQRDALQGQVEKLVSEVSGVGEGDLRVQAEVTADALGVLADSFNYMVEELGSLVVRVKTVANEVESSTATVLDRMTQLVETGDAQIKQINGAVVEVENMTSSSRQVAERSQSLYEVARNARQDANQGRDAVLQAIEGMGRINDNVQTTANKVQTLGERSREINEIVDAISSIAHQTNRLALDAAIQAAMAGENGKGFGAVAADIRRLAERSKDQAGLVTQIVRSVREDIGAVAVSMQDTERETAAGTRLTEATGIALRSIFSAVEQQAREVESINQAAMQQLQSSSAIVQIMRSVAETTQQNGHSTREASQHMERLARLVEQLRASTEAFKLRENQDYSFAGGADGSKLENSTEGILSPTGTFRMVSSTIETVPSYPGISNNFPPTTPQQSGQFVPYPPSVPLPWTPAVPTGPAAPHTSPSTQPWNESALWDTPNSDQPTTEPWNRSPQQAPTPNPPHSNHRR